MRRWRDWRRWRGEDGGPPRMLTCPRCGADNLPAARFCAACGVRMQGAAPGPPPLEVAVMASLPMAAPVVLSCRHCGRAMRPLPYFSRGVNIAKALALMIPFSVVGPLAFFFLRKDRLIC